MLKQFTILCIASLLLTACYGYDAPKKPKNLIPKSTMVNVLLDLNLINAVPRGENKKKLENNNLITAQYEVLKEQYKTKLDEEIQAKRKSKKEKK